MLRSEILERKLEPNDAQKAVRRKWWMNILIVNVNEYNPLNVNEYIS